RHRLGDHDLLFLGRVHVALAAHDQLGAAHGTVAPDFRVVAVIADDEADLQPLGALRDVGAVARIPALDRAPGHDLAVLLDELPLIVEQDQGVVGHLPGVLLVPLAGKREDAPGPIAPARLGEDLRLLTGDLRRGVHHLLAIVHDAVRAVLGENDDVQPWQADLHAVDHAGDIASVVENLRPGVQAGHLVVDHRDADRVVAAGDVAVKHGVLLWVRGKSSVIAQKRAEVYAEKSWMGIIDSGKTTRSIPGR